MGCGGDGFSLGPALSLQPPLCFLGTRNPLHSSLTPFLLQERTPGLSPPAGITRCVGARFLRPRAHLSPQMPTMETRGPPIRPKVHSLFQLVLGSAVLGIREDASVSRGGREGVTSTVPAMMSGVIG